ncbi:hypothetical protein M0657_002043 [Pyricularia oryzae]|uniref:Uncharacterized protein n=3 Tax=Pyricularia oryzae TaxID=318829 RepID=A0A4P7NKC6_PYROR|nr:hypothetical protein OOU_Y34scaffold00669g17 [Pyricularia oryzae Y34]KAI7928939.1 hypothetical protein M9X92_001518 [Pyricularia oryzae]KAI7929566.1 hypothetical protein M0657_002043 [Pyricularia oryzae]QBZ62555.1 hypothetical protein PoMZ_11437 [Pyricularia oryzae]
MDRRCAAACAKVKCMYKAVGGGMAWHGEKKESKDNTKPPSATSCAQSDEGVLWAEEERG